jgi:hypothetical protein
VTLDVDHEYEKKILKKIIFDHFYEFLDNIKEPKKKILSEQKIFRLRPFIGVTQRQKLI